MIKKGVILCIVMFVLFGCLHVKQKEEPCKTGIKAAYYEALQLCGEQDYDGTEQALKQIIEQDNRFYLAYMDLALLYSGKKDLDRIISYFKEPQRSGNPYTAWALGLVYEKKGELDRAIEYHKKSIDIERNFFGSYNGLVEAYLKQAQGDKSVVAELEEYLNTLKKIDPDNEGPSYGLGYLFYKMYKYNEALDCLTGVTKRPLVAFQSYYIMGIIYNDISDTKKAFEYHNKALAIYKEKGDRKKIAYILDNIGSCYLRLSNYATALEYYEQSLAIKKEVGDIPGEATVLSNIGNSYFHLSNYPRALEYAKKSLAIKKELGDTLGKAISFNNIGNIYSVVTSYPKALEYYEQSLVIARELGAKRGEGLLYRNIGNVYYKLANYPEALVYYERGLSLARETSDKAGEGAILNNLGSTYSRLENHAKSLEYYEQSLLLEKKTGNKSVESMTLNNIGNTYRILQNYPRALEYCKRSLAIKKAIGDKIGEGSALYNIGRTYMALKDYTNAFSYYSEAVTLAESMRGSFKSEQFKTDFFQRYSELYEETVICLYELHLQNPAKGYDKLAFTFVEKSKSRGLLDLLTESRADIKKGIDPELREQEESLGKKYSLLNTNLQKELSKPDQMIDSEKIAILKADIAALEEQLDQLKEKIIRKNPRYGEIKYPDPVTLDKVRQTLLDDNTIMVEYKITEDALYAWRITKDDYKLFKLDIGNKELSTTVTRLRNCFSSTPLPVMFYGPLSNNLYNALLFPLLKDIEKKDNLLIIPDGILHYLPFETLSDISSLEDNNSKETGNMYEQLTDGDIPFLIKNYTITYAQSAGVALNLAKGKKKRVRKNELFALGDPVFSNNDKTNEADLYLRSALTIVDKTREQRAGFSRLEASGNEVKNIAGLFKRADVFVREEATEERIKEKGGLKNYRYIHLATHSILNEHNPQFSGIVLTQDDDPSEDGFLQTWEIFNIELNSDLVVLSACQTGLGKEVSGEGLVGLTRAWMFAGADSVVVSLWNVEDTSTGMLMEGFYSNIKNNKAHSYALRQAKLALMEQGGGAYSHPVYWAGFVLIGGNK